MPNEILDTMQEEYERRSKNDPKLGEIRKQIKNGATYREAESYGTRSGEILSDVLQGNITEDVFNGDIPLEDLIVPMMRANYEKVVSATSAVQSSLNKSANIGMKAIVPDFNEEEAVNLVTKMLDYDSFDDAEWLLGEPIVTNSLGIVTDMLHENAGFQYRSGMSPKIVRTAEPDCCDWCAALEGVYEYRDLTSTDDVWKRHANCRCEVTYIPGEGKAQDVWSKRTLDDSAETRIRQNLRKPLHGDSIGIEIKPKTPQQRAIEAEIKSGNGKYLIETIYNNHYGLKGNTPEGWKRIFEQSGFRVKPLGKGELKGVAFEDGGGYRIVLQYDGGYFQYHPEKGSHHKDSYYKISSGKTGTRRYNLDGSIKND